MGTEKETILNPHLSALQPSWVENFEEAKIRGAEVQRDKS
jgi:hypothetical protein